VIGDGKLGILCARSLLNFSRNVVLIGKHPEKLKLGERSGAESVLAANAGKRERYFDVVVEASGSKSGFATALDIVKPRGKIVLKSTFHGTPNWEASRVVVDEISVIGSRCGRFAPALELLASRKVEVSDLVSEVFRLEDGVRAVETAGASGVLKVLLNNG
jgi:threonine dehydrogenase-like Zn-dependent dehydrogenase